MVSQSAVLGAALLLSACSRPAPPPERDGGLSTTPTGTLADTSASPDAELVGPLAAPSDAPAPLAPEAVEVAGLPPEPVEARRTQLRRLNQDRALAAQEALLRDHFDGGVPSPLELQTAALLGERRAYLASGEPRRRNPLLLVTNARGELLWKKERPLAGTRQVVTEMVVAAGPHGEVALLWCDIPTQVVGLRKWAPDGTVLADFEVLEVDVCEALSALYWPGRGWVAVASQHGSARAQLLDETGKRTWGPRGLELPWAARPSSPASIAVDTDVSVMLFQAGDRAREEGSAAPERVLAMRYDTLGTPLWEGALDLGPAPTGAAVRVAATRAEAGKVRVSLGTRGAVTVTSAGGILGAR